MVFVLENGVVSANHIPSLRNRVPDTETEELIFHPDQSKLPEVPAGTKSISKLKKRVKHSGLDMISLISSASS